MLDQELLDNLFSVNSVSLLLKKGANPNHADEEGRSLLMLAAQRKRKDIVELLIRAGADVKAVDKHQRTALFYAVEDNNCTDNAVSRVEILVDYILSLNVDMSAKDDAGMTAFDYGLRQKWHEGASVIFYTQLKSDLPLKDRDHMVETYRHRLDGNHYYGFLDWKKMTKSTLDTVDFLRELVSEQDGKPDSPLSKYVHFAKFKHQPISEWIKDDLNVLLAKSSIQTMLSEREKKKPTLFHSYVPASGSSSSSTSSMSEKDILKRIEMLEKKVAILEGLGISNSKQHVSQL